MAGRDTTKRIAFIKSEFLNNLRIYFVAWDDNSSNKREIPVTFEFTSPEKDYWVVEKTLVFDGNRNIHHIDLPSNWSYLMNKPQLTKVDIRWTFQKRSKLTLSDFLAGDKWMRSYVGLSWKTSKVGIFNHNGATLEFSNEDSFLTTKQVSDRTTTFELVTFTDSELNLLNKERHMRLNFTRACADCALFIESSFDELVKPNDCLKPSSLKYTIWYSDDVGVWTDVTKSALVTTSTGLISSSGQYFSLAEKNGQPVQTIRAEFMNQVSELPLIVWSLDAIKLTSDDTALNALDFCSPHVANSFDSFLSSSLYHQFTNVKFTGQYSNDYGEVKLKETTNLKSDSLRTNGQILQIEEHIFVTSTTDNDGQRIKLELICETKGSLLLDTVNEPVSVVGVHHDQIHMSDGSHIPASVYHESGLLQIKRNHHGYTVETLPRCTRKPETIFNLTDDYGFLTTVTNELGSNQMNYDLIIPALLLLILMFVLSCTCILMNSTRIKSHSCFLRKKRSNHDHAHRYEIVQL